MAYTPMHRLSARQLRQQFVEGKASATEIVHHFLKRIDKYNHRIGAFLSVYQERALSRAEALDRKRVVGDPLGRLAAVPVAIKDNIHVKGEITTCGSKFLTNYLAPFDATAVRLLEAEDAIIIGKTNLDEFGMGSSTENSALVKTVNPWDSNRIPGGSSGGSAAAVAARLCPIALGSDTGGSIRQPAAFCGIVGFKPSYGRVSRYGLVAFGSSLDQIGPLAASAEDASLAMEVIGRHCPKDSTSIPEPPEGYLFEERPAFEGKIIGIPWGVLEGVAGEPMRLFKEGIEKLENLGARIVNVDLDILKHSLAVYYIVATAEASTNLARFDGIRYGVRSSRAETLDQVYDYSKEEGFGPEVKRRILLGTYVLSSGYQEAFYRKAQKVRTLIADRYKAVFHECHLVAMPTTPSAAFRSGEMKTPLEMYLEDIYTISANLAGLPAASVPCGFTNTGLPFGLQLIGSQRDDVKVLRAATAFQHAMPFSNAIPKQFEE